MEMSTLTKHTDTLFSETIRDVCEWRASLWAPVLKEALANLRVDQISGRRVLEIGYGTGRYLVFWAQHGAQFTCIERGCGTANRASELANQFGVSEQCEFLEGDFFKLTINLT